MACPLRNLCGHYVKDAPGCEKDWRGCGIVREYERTGKIQKHEKIRR